MQSDNFGYLLHHLSSTLERQAEQLLQKKLKIGFSQFKILMALQWCSGVQQKQIATYLGQTEASISRQIKLMSEDGLLINRLSPTNRREHITTLTARGERVASKAIQSLDDFFKPLLDLLPSSQQLQLVNSLSVLHKGVCQSGNNQCGYSKD